MRHSEILVILGNPPYKGESKNNGEYIKKLVNDYKFIDGQSINERNSKWLNDDYVKFIRFAQSKMDKAEEGIVAVITNHGYLDNPTFKGMRASLLKTFDQIYIINLHGNSKKKEVSPDGSKDKNVFDIQQGVCITFFVKKPGVKRGAYYTDWWGTRENKYRNCITKQISSIEWLKANPISPSYLLASQGQVSAFYSAGKSIKEIFNVNGTGIITARDSLAINYTQDELQEKLELLRDHNISDNTLINDLHLKDTRSWKFSKARGKFVNLNKWTQYFKKISYRPFDNREIYYHPTMVDSGRENVMKHMLAGENVGLMVCRQSKTTGWQHVLVTSCISESSYVSNKTCEIGYLFPLYLYNTPSPQNHLHPEGERMENFLPEFRLWIDKHYSHRYSPEEILGYIYGVLHSSTYRTKYLHFLKMDFPRIPFDKSRKIFEEMSKLGQELIQTHLMKEVPDLKLGAYISQGSNKVEKINYDEKAQKLFINSEQYFENVPKEIWEFHIGGYQVLAKYLKSRKGRELSPDEIQNMENVVNILAFTIKQMEKIDEVYKKIDDLD